MAQTLMYRIAQIITKIGTNGTKIAEPTDLPKGQSNSERDTWLTRHKIVCEYLYASTISRAAESRTKKAKKAVQDAFSIELSKMKVGDKELHNFSNVGIQLELRTPRYEVKRELILPTLAAKGWKMDDINKFIEAISEETKPPLYLTCSTTAE